MAGEALVDLIVRADGEIVSIAGGSPYNSVRAIARLGVAASWVGGLSSDRFGRMLEDGLAADGVGRELVQRTDLPTTLALAELGADGSASYRFYTEATSAPNVLPEPLAGGIPASARAFLTGSLGLVLEPMASTLEAVASAVPRDRIVMLDPNARPSITRDPDAWRASHGAGHGARRHRQGQHRGPRVPAAGRDRSRRPRPGSGRRARRWCS